MCASYFTPLQDKASGQGIVRLRYRETEQYIEVAETAYLEGKASRYRNWQLASPASFIAVPLLLSQFIADTCPKGMR